MVRAHVRRVDTAMSSSIELCSSHCLLIGVCCHKQTGSKFLTPTTRNVFLMQCHVDLASLSFMIMVKTGLRAFRCFCKLNMEVHMNDHFIFYGEHGARTSICLSPSQEHSTYRLYALPCCAVESLETLPSSRAVGSASISCLSSPHVGILNVLGFEHKPSAE